VTFGAFGRGSSPQAGEMLPDGRPRLPPGQRLVEGWPVLHYGGIPQIDLADWELRVFGLVGEELRFDLDQIRMLPQVKLRRDIHCVTTWSRYDNDWEGISFQHLMELAKPTPEAKHVVFHCYGGYTTNVPIEELDRDDVLLVHTHDGEPLTAQHGAPLRGMVPQLYFWKSAKWISGIEFVTDERPGFWEMYGYHMHGDPWREERYG
jgi:DMSO/TMAO reductase YedYZ molybdopterin-dependent catalytic subunit